MGLQNRVAPDGSLHASSARGLFTGNRGIIHDPDTKTLSGRRWTTQSWIVCACEWKGRKREVWGRNGRKGGLGWTELFFLDEVTALAAGHRPCFTCRREAAKSFIAAFNAANRVEKGTVKERDDLLHSQRWLSSRQQPETLSGGALRQLPDGAMVEADGKFFALRDQCAVPWGFGGYGKAAPRDALQGPAYLVTPRAIVKALAAGFEPVWHDSAA